MRTSPLRYCLTLLLASGGCLLGSAAPYATPACAQTLPPQGVPNVTGSATADGPVNADGTNSPTNSTVATSPTSTASSSASTAASTATTTTTTATAPSAAASTTTANGTATVAPTASSSPLSPSPSGAPASNSSTAKTSATGASPALPQAGAIAAAEESAESDDTVYLENADLLRLTSDNSAVLTGNVKVRYRDYTLFADKAVVNSDTGRVEFDGNIRVLSSADQTTINATDPKTHLELDTRNNSYSIVGPQHAVIDQSLFAGSGLVLPLRIDSNDAYSVNNILDVRQGGFTTCDFLHPHYVVGARGITVVPGRRIVARHAVLYRRGRRLFEIPYLIVPLSDRYDRATYLPLIGEDPEEGYFAKFAIPYALTGAALGVLRLDYMSAIGTGTGFDQSYQAHGPNAGGTLTFYHLDDAKDGLQELTATIAHEQTIGNFRVGVNTQFENNSYDNAVGASQNLNGTLNVSGSEGRSTTLFTGNLVQTNYGSETSSNLTASLNQLEQLGGLNTLGVKLNYTGTDASEQAFQIGGASVTSAATTTGTIGTTGTTAALAATRTIGTAPVPPLPTTSTTLSTTTSERATLASNIDLHLQPNGLMVDLQTDLFSTIQNTTAASLESFAGLQRRPELMLSTTGTGSDPLDEIAHLIRGSQLKLGFGDYIESASGHNNDRVYFSYDGGNQVRRTGDFTLTSDSSYQQMYYNDGGAQYLLDGRYGSAYTHGPLTLSANYSTLRAYGFTPFLFDRPGDYNNANFTLGYSPTPAYTLSAVTAYNFLQDQGVYETLNGVRTLITPAAPWQNLIAVLSVHPNPLLNDQLQGSYDPNHGRLFDVNNSFYAANKTGFGFRTAFDYLPERSRLGLVNGALDLPIILDQREQAGYKIQAIAGYDGLTSKFTYQGLALTRSWHDFEVTATYQNNPFSFGATSNIFSFTFHLKALPGYQPFGVGASGQEFSGGVGQVY